MKVLFDTNVVLDLLIDRAPHAEAAARLFAAVERGIIGGCLGATTLTTIHYLSAKTLGREQARQAVADLLTLFEIAPITRPVLEAALTGNFDDFEDSVIHQAACQSGAQAIVTRNGKDFRGAELPVYAPEEMLKVLRAMGLERGAD